MADVIVIGGGIAGCTAAYYLAADGVDVTLLEQHELNALASGSNAGSLHAQIQPEAFAHHGEDWARRYAAALPFYAESIALWQLAEQALDVDFEIAQVGGLTVAADDREMRMLEAKASIERAAGLDIELLRPADLRELAPYVSTRMVGAAFCPIEGKANPLLAAPAFAAAAAARGATILERRRVTAIGRSGTGYEVMTSDGTFRAARIIDAAGTEAGRIAALVGIDIALQSFPIQLCVTAPLAPLIDHLVYAGSEMLTLKQTRDGTILIGGGWPAVVDAQGRARVSRDSLQGNLTLACDVVPALASTRIVRTWAAHVNGNESWLPLLGELPGVRDFFLNYVPWMGFSGAPAASRIVASLAQGRDAPVDFDISLFGP